MIYTIDHHHHQATSAAKSVTRTVNDRYPTLALAVAMPALVVVGVLAVLAPEVVNCGTEADVEEGVETGTTPGADAEVVGTALELVLPELAEEVVTETD